MRLPDLLPGMGWEITGLFVCALTVLLLLIPRRGKAVQAPGNVDNQMMRKALEQLYPLMAQVNLTRNTARVYQHDGFLNKETDGEISYDAFIAMGMEDTPSEEGRRAFADVFGRNAVLSAFRSGKTHVELEHQHLMGDGRVHWLRSRTVRVESGSEDETALSVSMLIDDEMTERLAQRKNAALMGGLMEDYEAIFYSEPWLDQVTALPRNGAGDRDGGMVSMSHAAFAEKLSEEFVNPREAAHIRNALQAAQLIRRFSDATRSPRQVLTGLRQTGEGNRYFQIKLMMVDPLRDTSEFGVVIGLKNADDVIRDQKNYEKSLEIQVASQTDQLRENLEKLTQMQSSVIESMATLVESRDVHTGDHVRNTRTLVTMLVNRLRRDGIFPALQDDQYAQNIITGSVLHDIGKIFISDVILNKRGKLTPEEFQAMKMHTTLGKEIVEEIFADKMEKDSTDVIRDIVYCHHEYWDGRGYPQGLKGEDIPLAARIMAVADVLDALVSRRSYKEAFPLEVAFSIIRNESGSHFDRRIVNTLMDLEPEIRSYMNRRGDDDGHTTLSGAVDSMIESIQDRSVTGAFVEDYEAAVIVCPDTGKGRLLYVSDYFRQIFSGKFRMDHYYDSIASMLGRQVNKEDLPAFLSLMSAEGMKNCLAHRENYTLNYRAVVNGNENYHMQMRLIRIDYATGERNFDVLVGCKDVEVETCRIQEEHRQERMARDVITSLSDDFEAIYYVELENDSIQVIRAQERFIRHHPGLRQVKTYTEFVEKSIMEVYEDDRDSLKRHLRPTQVREILSAVEANYFDYRRLIQDRLVYYQVKLVRTVQWEEKGAFILGIHNADDETRQDMQHIHAMRLVRLDGLTGLLNRVVFEQDVDRYCARATSRNTVLTYFDLDTFKKLNDELGNSAGDRILEITAEELRRSFPTNTLIGRMGGDSFAVFLPTARREEVEARLEELHLRACRHFAEEFPDRKITLSIGCVICRAAGLDFNDMRVLADREIYRAKLSGRNCTCLREVTGQEPKE